MNSNNKRPAAEELANIVRPGPKLVFEPSWWEVTLRDGSVIELRADAAQETEDYLVFSVLTEGKPKVDVEITWIPRSAVASWEGGYLEPRRQRE